MSNFNRRVILAIRPQTLKPGGIPAMFNKNSLIIITGKIAESIVYKPGKRKIYYAQDKARQEEKLKNLEKQIITYYDQIDY